MPATVSPASARAKKRILPKNDACLACKARKIRCSADKPICRKCQKTARRCVYPRWTSDEAGGTLGEAGSHLEGITAASAPAVSLDDSASSSNAIFQPEVGVIDTTWASFLPSLGAAQEDQALPMLWDEVDFSWLTDGAEDSGNNSTPSPSASDRAQAEITEDQKQHLLWTFFTNQKIFGVEMNILRFYERLGSNDPAVKPHPCLLNAIYLFASESSPASWARHRISSFASAAELHIHELLKHDHLVAHFMLDLMRAATLLGSWYLTRSREAQADTMLATAARCAIAGRFDRIPTSDIARLLPDPPHPNTQRARLSFAPAPQDQVDLTERIHAFWALWTLMACTTIITSMPPAIDLLAVTTPLPRLWSESAADGKDERLEDVFMDGRVPATHLAPLAQVVKAVHLLYLSSLRVLQHGPNTSNTRVHEIETAIQRLGQWAQTRAEPPCPGHLLAPQQASLQMILTAATIYLHDTNAENEANDVALYHCKRFIGLIKMLPEQDTDELGLFICALWAAVGKVLIRESKRLSREGDMIGAAIVDADIDAIVDRLTARAIGLETAMALGQLSILLKLRQPSTATAPLFDGEATSASTTTEDSTASHT